MERRNSEAVSKTEKGRTMKDRLSAGSRLEKQGTFTENWHEMNILSLYSIIDKWTKGRESAIIAIDGRCGSGKSSLAAQLQRRYPCNVIHMDDFYLPPERRAPQWRELPAGNMDLERLLDEVLLPLRAGERVTYRPFSCKEGRMLEPASGSGHRLTIVEGSYSHHPLLAGLYQEKIFLTCSRPVQEQRLRQREGERFAHFRGLWIPMEERYFQAFQLPSRETLVLDTSYFF